MRAALCLSAVCVVAAIAIGDGPDDRGNLAHARQAFAERCANCHFAPDLTIERDRVWLGMIKTTAWSGTAGDGSSPERLGLIAYLSSDEVKRAARVDASAKPDLECGRVSVPFEAGSVYLACLDRPGDDRRVVWTKGDKAHPVPAGRYQVRHWSIEAEHEGETWILSITPQSGPAIAVMAGEDLVLDLNTKVHVDGQFARHAKASRLELSIHGGNRMGLSVIRGDKRVEIGYRIEGRDGQEVGKGVMTYGWGGGCSAEIRPDQAHAATGGKATFQLDAGPFEIEGSLDVKITK